MDPARDRVEGMDGMTRSQRTLDRTVATGGVGLHSGELARLWLHPAPPGHGVRIHKRGSDEVIPARVDSAQELSYATRLGLGEASVSTVEHLLSALAGLGVDNVRIELDGPEIPIKDGSALPFVRLIERAGIVEQPAPVSALRILAPIEVREDGKWIRVEPAAELVVDYRIAFDNPAIGYQRFVGAIDPETYREAISPARTFGFLKEVNYLRSRGLARGGSLSNCVVVDGPRVLSGELRFADEFVRHKVLDLIGDLSLLEYPLIGRVTAHKAGHALHAALSRAILEQPEKWAIVGPEGATTLVPFPVETGGLAMEAMSM